VAGSAQPLRTDAGRQAAASASLGLPGLRRGHIGVTQSNGGHAASSLLTGRYPARVGHVNKIAYAV